MFTPQSGFTNVVRPFPKTIEKLYRAPHAQTQRLVGNVVNHLTHVQKPRQASAASAHVHSPAPPPRFGRYWYSWTSDASAPEQVPSLT
jgi:hypothetical protein